jgi:hypothetical protein
MIANSHCTFRTEGYPVFQSKPRLTQILQANPDIKLWFSPNLASRLEHNGRYHADTDYKTSYNSGPVGNAHTGEHIGKPMGRHEKSGHFTSTYGYED